MRAPGRSPSSGKKTRSRGEAREILDRAIDALIAERAHRDAIGRRVGERDAVRRLLVEAADFGGKALANECSGELGNRHAWSRTVAAVALDATRAAKVHVNQCPSRARAHKPRARMEATGGGEAGRWGRGPTDQHDRAAPTHTKASAHRSHIGPMSTRAHAHSRTRTLTHSRAWTTRTRNKAARRTETTAQATGGGVGAPPTHTTAPRRPTRPRPTDPHDRAPPTHTTAPHRPTRPTLVLELFDAESLNRLSRFDASP